LWSAKRVPDDGELDWATARYVVIMKGRDMKKSFLLIIIALLFLAGTSVAGAAQATVQSSQPVSTFEGGSLYKSGKLNILDLHGSYRQMGRQYGRLIKDDLHSLYKKAVEDYFIGQKGLSREILKKTAMSLFNFYPQRFKEIIQGMAETSGLSIDKHIVLNGLELYGSISGCAGIAAWSDYTKGGPLIFGRNYDWFDSYKEFAKYLTVTVLNPDSGIPCAIVAFAGVIYATTGMNAKGIFLELNNGLPSGGALSYSNRVPAIINLLAFLCDCSTMEHLHAAFNTTRSNFAFIINTADKNGAYSYEWAPFDIKRRTGEAEGLLVATNHFTDPAWGIELQDNAGFKTVLRRKNLLSLGHKNKGRMNLATMMEILDTPIDKGGATWPVGEEIQTVYQIIAVPRELKLWVQVPGFQDWTGVDLAAIFISR